MILKLNLGRIAESKTIDCHIRFMNYIDARTLEIGFALVWIYLDLVIGYRKKVAA